MSSGGRLAVELRPPDESRPIAVEWDPERVAALRDAGRDDAEQPWRVSVELSRERVERLRVLSAAFDDGSLLGVAALRPPGVAGHGDEQVRAVLARPDQEPAEIAEALLSTQYGPDGSPTRAGLELYSDSEAPPFRVAANRLDNPDPGNRPGGGTVFMSFTIDGVAGAGLYESVHPGPSA